MVSEKKKQTVREVKELIEKYSVIGVIDMQKMPAKQLQQIREKSRDKAIIKMVKKNLIKLVLKETKKVNFGDLEKYIQGQPALLFSNTDPFELAKIISQSKSKALAKPNDLAPADIIVRGGLTNLPPGPIIGELQRVGIPAKVEGDKIAVKEDTKVAKKGEKINKQLADVLAKLNIEPIEICLNILAVYDNGLIYTKNLLFILKEQYIENLKNAYLQAFNLAFNTNYFTPQTLPLLISKAHNQALNLAVNANILTPETAKLLLQKAHTQMRALSNRLNK